MDLLEKMSNSRDSSEYLAAFEKISGWHKAIDKLTVKGLGTMKMDINSFFNIMKHDSPDVYANLAIERKILLEKIFKKRTGVEIIID